ncbi:hypothetical protein Nmel_006230 [Mimus melanotis]
MRKNFCRFRAASAGTAAQGGRGVSLSERIPNPPGLFPCSLLQQVTLPGSEGWTRGDLQRPLPNHIVLGFCEITTVSEEFGLGVCLF